MRKLLVLLSLSLMLVGCGNEAILAPVAVGSWMNFDRRPAKTIIDDQTLTLKANMALVKNKCIWRNSHISTLSYNNSILLVGQTQTKAYKQEIEKIVQQIGGVGAIYNQITVECPTSLNTRTQDSWITTQVKSRIMTNRNVGINRVKVITEACVVYLMGSLTQDEECTAVQIARCVPGVKKVVTAFERQENVTGPPPPVEIPCPCP